MGKYLEQLKTGDPNRKVSDQELLNVMCETIAECIEILNQTHEKLRPTIERLKRSNNENKDS